MIGILHRFKLKPGTENTFKQSWRTLSTYYKKECGALGACLHKTKEGLMVTYSRWPDQKTWQHTEGAQQTAGTDIFPIHIHDAIEALKDCVEVFEEPEVMDAVDDLLITTDD